MFGPPSKNRNSSPSSPGSNSEPQAQDTASTAEDSSASVMGSPALQRMATPTPSGRRLPEVSRRSASSGDSGRKLIVGEGLSVSGEITSCDILVVAGKVEAKVTDGKLLEVNESGQFRGSVEIENADIAGRYDGQLVVHGRLTVRSTGRISGMVKYGELEINAGGQIIGELQVTGGGAQAASGNGGFKSASKFTPLIDDDAPTSASDDRKSA